MGEGGRRLNAYLQNDTLTLLVVKGEPLAVLALTTKVLVE